MNTHLIGVGGVGSWLAHSLVKLIDPTTLVLCDGDRVEPKNLDRQFFKETDTGLNKAQALAERLGCHSVTEYFSQGQHEFSEDDVLICCADNNPARVDCLIQADLSGIRVIIAANEATSAEAYYYDGDGMYFTEQESWLDPRVYYPELLQDKTNDPRAAAIGCVQAAQFGNRQLVSANFMAAALAQWLYVLWVIELEGKLGGPNPLDLAKLPYRFRANASRLETHLIGDAIKERSTE